MTRQERRKGHVMSGKFAHRIAQHGLTRVKWRSIRKLTGRRLGGFAIVIAEEAAHARSFLDNAVVPSHFFICMNDAATQSLVVSLSVVMLHVLLDSQAKVLLTKCG